MNPAKREFKLTIRDLLWLVLVVAILCVTQAGISAVLMTIIVAIFILSTQREITSRTRSEDCWQQKHAQQQDRIKRLEKELAEREVPLPEERI